MATHPPEIDDATDDDRDLAARLLIIWGVGATFILSSGLVLGLAVRLYHLGAGG